MTTQAADPSVNSAVVATAPHPHRKVIHGDAFVELPRLGPQCAIITSLPDAAELNKPLDAWREWFVGAAKLVFESTAPEGVAIFYQTDRRAHGSLIAKDALLIGIGARLLWHKIAVRRYGTDPHRPTYSHLLAFSEQAGPGKATSDVIEDGTRLWQNGMGVNAAAFAAREAARLSSTLIDPFCGAGTVLAAGDLLFERLVGIELDAERCAKARTAWIV